MAEEFKIPGLQEAATYADNFNKELKETIALFAKVASEGQKASASYRSVGSVKGYKEYDLEIKKLNDLLAKQQEQINKIVSAKKNLNEKSRQEVIDQRALRKEADLEAKSKSKLVGAYQNLVAKQQQAKKSLQDLIVTQGKGSAATKQAQKEYDKLTAKVNQANKATSNFSNTGLGKLATGFKSLLGAFGLVGGAYLFADFARGVITTIKELDKLNFTLQTVIENEGELARTRGFLNSISLRYGAEIVSTTERYTKFMVAARQSGLALKETEKIFESVTQASAVLGLKTDELNGIYLALEQMLSKGKVTTEELRRQLGERLPGAFGLMAEALNVSTAELDTMLKKGEILSKDALPKLAEKIKETFGGDSLDSVNTLQTATSRLSTSWTLFIDTLNKGIGVGKLWEGILDSLGDGLRKISGAFGGNVVGAEQKAMESYSKTLQDTDRGSENYLTTIQKLREEQDKLSTQHINAKKQLEDLRIPMFGLIKDYEDEKAQLEKTIGATNGKYKAIESYIELLKNKSKQEKIDKLQIIDKIILLDESLKQGDLEKQTLESLIALYAKLSDEKDENNKKTKIGVDYVKGSLSYLEAQINLFEKQQKDLARNGKEWQVYSEKIDKAKKAVNDFKIAINGVSEIKTLGDVESAFKRISEIAKDKDFGKIEGLDLGGLDSLKEWSDNYKKQQEKILELTKYYADQRQDIEENLSENIKDLAFNVGEAIFQSQLNRLDKEEALAEKNAEKALQYANGSAAAEAQIKEQLAAKKEEIEKKRLETERKAFLFEQAFKAGEIAIDTIKAVAALKAQAAILAGNPVTAALAALPLSQIPLVITSGAVAGAAVLAQSLPAFKDGVRDFDGGLAVLGDGGVSEIVRTPDGKISKTPNKDTLYNLPKGTDVFKSEADFNKELDKMLDLSGINLFQNSMSNMIPNVIVQDNGIKPHEMDAILGKHFSNLKSFNVNFDENGVKKWVTNGNATTILHNNRTSGRGISV